MRIVTFKIDEDLLSELDSFAKIKGVTRSEVIRKAIELYLKLATPMDELKIKKVRLES